MTTDSDGNDMWLISVHQQCAIPHLIDLSAKMLILDDNHILSNVCGYLVFCQIIFVTIDLVMFFSFCTSQSREAPMNRSGALSEEDSQSDEETHSQQPTQSGDETASDDDEQTDISDSFENIDDEEEEEDGHDK